MEPVGYTILQIYIKELQDDHLMSSIWAFNGHCSRAVLVLRVSPVHDNIKCRHITQQTLFVPLSMNPSALDISISTINPYCYSFFINSPFLWNNIPTNLLQITNRKLSMLHFGTFFFDLYYLTFCTCLCCILYMLLLCTSGSAFCATL